MFCELVFLLLSLPMIAFSQYANILLVLTDDQDADSLSAFPLMATTGLVFSNAFVTTPVCCVSRASILTGLYAHNHGVTNNSHSGNCGTQRWQKKMSTVLMPMPFAAAGFDTFYAGKYLNGYTAKYRPKGWTNWNGLKGDAAYYDYTLLMNNTRRHFGHNDSDYLTTVIGQLASEFLANNVLRNRPFLAVLAPPAPHAPYIPEAQYMQDYSNLSVPRTDAYNLYSPDKHWIVSSKPAMTLSVQSYVDAAYRNRWRTLESVNRVLESLISQLQNQGQLNNTFIIVTSDNGFHTGQFRMPLHKKLPYEFDIRVPMAMIGPGVSQGTVTDPVLNIDLFPTMVDLAGLPALTTVDGRSFRSSIFNQTVNNSRTFLVEYWGEHGTNISPSCKPIDMTLADCYPTEGCACADTTNNTYTCVRRVQNGGDNGSLVYCSFVDSLSTTEFYDLAADPMQLNNTAPALNASQLSVLDAEMMCLKQCRGASDCECADDNATV